MELDAYQMKIAEIRRRFIGRLDSMIARIEECLSGGDDHASLTESRRILHEMAGTAPTLGLSELGADSRQLEEIVADAIASGRSLTNSEIERLRTGIQDLSKHAQKARETHS